jgi:hypothetical protein
MVPVPSCLAVVLAPLLPVAFHLLACHVITLEPENVTITAQRLRACL